MSNYRKLIGAAALLIVYAVSGFSAADAQKISLPEGARILEIRALGNTRHADRELVLWMLRPEEYPRDTSDDIYTCPEYTRGHYLRGPTRVSLVNRRTGKIINTIEVRPDYQSETGTEDKFDLPYKIRAGFYYQVPRARKWRESKPTIMRLRDYNGDGKALEFALYDALACMGLATTLIGYSETQDQVIQYPVTLTLREGGQVKKETSYFTDYLFSQRPVRRGRWRYEIDYRGRGGTLDQYTVKYDARREQFVGTLNRTP